MHQSNSRDTDTRDDKHTHHTNHTIQDIRHDTTRRRDTTNATTHDRAYDMTTPRDTRHTTRRNTTQHDTPHKTRQRTGRTPRNKQADFVYPKDWFTSDSVGAVCETVTDFCSLVSSFLSKSCGAKFDARFFCFVTATIRNSSSVVQNTGICTECVPCKLSFRSEN